MIRSDNVLLAAGQTDDAVRVHVRRMGVEHPLVPDGTGLRGAVTVLVSDGRREVEDAIVEEAQFRCIPVYVADRPSVSDFSVLDFLDRRWPAAPPPNHRRRLASGAPPNRASRPVAGSPG